MVRMLFVSALVLAAAMSAMSQQRFSAALSGAQEVPANASAGKASCTIVLNAAQTQIMTTCTFSGLGSNGQAAHIHGNGVVGVNAPILFNLGVPASTSGTIGPVTSSVTPAQVADMRAHLWYVNIHSVNLPNGEIRGQIKQANTVFDYDGDGRTDVVVFRQSGNIFYILSSLNGSLMNVPLGTGSGDNWINLTGDFDGDGRGDPVLITLAGTLANWSIFQTGTNVVRNVQWGDFSAAINDTLAPSDYDGDGIEDIAVFRRSDARWWTIRSSDNARVASIWGTLNDFPSIGDYDGDGKADLTIVRVVSGQRQWWTLFSSNGQNSGGVNWGLSATDGLFFFAPIDVDGDGKQDRMVTRTVSGQKQFHILRSSDFSYLAFTWGFSPGDTTLFGDYDGDGKTDFIQRRNEGGQYVWYILRSSNGYSGASPVQAFWGTTNDQ